MRPLPMAAPRSCGSCTACCTLMGVSELPKQPWVTCEHVCEAGCGIYPDRPEGCRTFSCGWLLGFGEPSDRPDRSGLMLTYSIEPGREAQPVHPREPVPVAWEVWPGASTHPRGRGLIQRLNALGYSVFSKLYGEEATRTLYRSSPGGGGPQGGKGPGGDPARRRRRKARRAGL